MDATYTSAHGHVKVRIHTLKSGRYEVVTTVLCSGGTSKKTFAPHRYASAVDFVNAALRHN